MSFSEIIGQDRAIGILKGALASGRMASSYIFAGEQGVGRKSAAKALASALNCVSPVGKAEACGHCPSCVKIKAGTHPDFFFIEPDGAETKIEQIRELGEALYLKAFEGRAKIAVIAEAQTLNQSSSNAFLKMLEEPPPQTYVILVTHAPDMLLPTIRSRCVRINFHPLSPHDTERAIAESFKRLRKELPPEEELNDLSRLAMGRPGLAITEDLLSEREKAMEVFLNILKPYGRAQWKERSDMEAWFDAALGFLRDMAVLKIAGPSGDVINRSFGPGMAALCEGTDLRVIIKGYEELAGLRDGLRHNLNKGITWNLAGIMLRDSGIGRAMRRA